MWEHKEKYLKIVDRLTTLLFYTMSDPHNGHTLTLLLTYPKELGSWFILWLKFLDSYGPKLTQHESVILFSPQDLEFWFVKQS